MNIYALQFVMDSYALQLALYMHALAMDRELVVAFLGGRYCVVANIPCLFVMFRGNNIHFQKR